jgi:hypothetical protein
VRPKLRTRAIILYKKTSRVLAWLRGLGKASRSDPVPTHSSAAWIEAQQSKWGSADWRKVGENEEIVNVPARNLHDYVDAEYQAVQRLISPAPFVAEIPEGHVVGEHGVVITPDHRILMDISFPMGEAQRYFNSNATAYVDKLNGMEFRFADEFFHDARLPARRVKGTVALLSSHAGRGYFHWMYDVLPRLGLLERAGHDLAEIDYFIIPMRAAGFHFETLEVLGIDESRLISSFNHRHVVADRLLAPSLTRPAWAVPTWVVDYLRQAFRPSKPEGDDFPTRIYIVRKSTDHGILEGEDKLTARLRERGFVPLAMEDFTLREKAWLLSRAEVVLGPSGAGLSNIVFCRPGTKVIEIRVQPFPVKEPWAIANRCGLDFYDVLPVGYGGHDKSLVATGTVGDDDIFATLDLAGLA